MSIELAERLKREFTDKWVVVQSDVPELKRFEGLTGRVKTVNMNCRALVEFDNPVDISWYDIDPSFLSVVDEPKPKPKAEPKAKKAAPAKAEGKPAAKTAGLSPLELARQQAAGGAKPAAEKKAGLSPLEMARQQGAAGGAKAEAAPAAPKESPKAAPSGKAMSPLEMARMQGAGGSAEAAPEAAAPTEEPVVEEQSAAPEAAPAKPAASDDDDANLSPLERARKQGAPKK